MSFLPPYDNAGCVRLRYPGFISGQHLSDLKRAKKESNRINNMKRIRSSRALKTIGGRDASTEDGKD